MAIVPLQKLTLFGSLRDRDAVLEQLQQLGCLHLLDLADREGGVRSLDRTERNEVEAAIKYLESCPVQNPKQRTHYVDGQSCIEVARETLELKRHQQQGNDRLDKLQRQINTLEPWGEFGWYDLRDIGGQRLWFYAIPLRELGQLYFKSQPDPQASDSSNTSPTNTSPTRQRVTADLPPNKYTSELVWQQINQDRQFAYVVVVQATEPELPWPALKLPRQPLSELRRQVETTQAELEHWHWQRVELTHWLSLLHRDLAQTDDWLERIAAAERTYANEQVFALQAWMPKPAHAAIQELARRYRLALTFVDPLPDEQPPTLLQNPRAVAGAEAAVAFYITPSYRAWDPTWVMFLSLSIFFAMIVSDAAYGVIYGIGLLLFWKRLGSNETARRVRNLCLAMVSATIIYGIAVGSYFGTTPSGLAWLQIQVEGQPLLTHKEAMMILSLGIGVFHLCLANGISAWQQRWQWQALASFGWAMGILGGYVWGLFSADTNKAAVWLSESLALEVSHFQPLLMLAGQVGLFGGLALIFLFSSSRPLLSSKPTDWLWRIIDGLLSLTNVTKAFGDTLSYLRLFALGFASAQLAMTFNDMAAGMQSVPGVGILLAVLILLLGHTVNMVLGIMGGVVHGLRLNCIEFFNWSLTEEGRPFQAFSKKAT